MNAAMAAWYGVAVALVTGDDAAVEEVKASAPAVRTVAVKRAINTRAVELLPLAEARRQIEDGRAPGGGRQRRSRRRCAPAPTR